MTEKQISPVDSDVAISSRVRLARNLGSTPFPGRMEPEDSKKVVTAVKEVLLGNKEDSENELIYIDIQKLNSIDRQLLVEKHLISPDFTEGKRERGAIVSKDEIVSIMINEEDHLRLQCKFPGKQLEEAWKLCSSYDMELESKLDYAFDPGFGYLTCCPTNVGTGMRASIMLHLPALVMTGYISNVLDACGKLGVAVRGMYGEKSDALGNMFQISNQVTLGQTEEEIIASVNNLAGQIIEQERALRGKLYRQSPVKFEDRVFRSYGLFTNARIMTGEECLKLLSDVRLGIDMGIIKNIDIDMVNELTLYVQPAHLQKLAGRPLSPDERDMVRVEFIQKRLKGLEW